MLHVTPLKVCQTWRAACPQGESNRVIGEHQLNRESSRSHSIFTISLEMRLAGESGETIVRRTAALHRHTLLCMCVKVWTLKGNKSGFDSKCGWLARNGDHCV
eukprot:366319-Chlamydomonas_euryale.AAC.14